MIMIMMMIMIIYVLKTKEEADSGWNSQGQQTRKDKENIIIAIKRTTKMIVSNSMLKQKADAGWNSQGLKLNDRVGVLFKCRAAL